MRMLYTFRCLCVHMYTRLHTGCFAIRESSKTHFSLNECGSMLPQEI